jgi:hypothetical protein
MVHLLQKLLGQLAPPGMAAADGGGGGMALDPAGGSGRAKAWLFELPEEKRERIRQTFQSAFPRRYDSAIKLYYEAIAKDE